MVEVEADGAAFADSCAEVCPTPGPEETGCAVPAVAGGAPAAGGASVALLSGSAIEMSESKRRSFSVNRELRRITGWDSIFISCPNGDASKLPWAPSASPAPPGATVFIEALPLRLTFMLSSFTSRSQKSVEMPSDRGMDELAVEQAAMEMLLDVGPEQVTAWGVPRDRPPPLPDPEEDPVHRRVSSSVDEEEDKSLHRC